MIRRYLILICIFSSVACLSQSVERQTDSLLMIIDNSTSDSIIAAAHFEIGSLILYSDPLKAISHCQQIIKLEEKLNDPQAIANAYVLNFNAHLYYGSPSDTLLWVIKSLEDHVESKMEEVDMIRVYWIYALYYQNIKQADKSIEAYIQALNITKKHESKKAFEPSLLGCIGEILLSQGKSEEALAYFDKAIKLGGGPITVGFNQYFAGKAYTQLGEHEKAYELFKEAYENNKTGNDIGGMARALIELGYYFDRKENFERANMLYTEALQLIQDNNIGSLLPIVYVAFAEHNFESKNFKSSITYAELSLSETENQKNYEVLNQTFQILQKCYAAVGDYESAYLISGRQMAYRDSVNNSVLTTKVQALKTEFEVAQKETENELLKAEAVANQKSILIRNITGAALLLGLLLLGSWAMVVFRTSQRKQKYNEILEAKVAERTIELEKANKDLAQLNYELKTFNYIASHDIKEPIRNIGSYTGLIYHKLPVELQSKFESYFNTIKTSTSQLYNVVEDFSNYTKLSKNDEIELGDVDLNTMLLGMEVSLGNHAKEKNIRIINEGLPVIKSNSSLIYTVMKNIIDNGLKFNNSTTPTVSVKSKQSEEYTEIFIKDNGIGIDMEYQSQIFEIFKRLHHRQEFQGSGVGLAVVKLLMDKLGGKVKLESKLNEGSVFILRLPN